MPLPMLRRSPPICRADHLLVMNMCGRGDKDIFSVAEHSGSSFRKMAGNGRIAARFAALAPQEDRGGLVTFR